MWKVLSEGTLLSLVAFLITGELLPLPWWAFPFFLFPLAICCAVPERALTSRSEKLSAVVKRPDRTFLLLSIFTTYAPFIVALTLTFIASPVLPLETLDLRSGEHMVAFVLNDEGPTLTVLRDRDRKVVRIPVASVVSREFCSPAGTPKTSQHFFTTVNRPYPLCPKK
jgi:hypothetical protein